MIIQIVIASLAGYLLGYFNAKLVIDEKIKIPIITKIKDKKEIKKERIETQKRLLATIANIESYDGTAKNQKRIRR